MCIVLESINASVKKMMLLSFDISSSAWKTPSHFKWIACVYAKVSKGQN